MSAGTVVSALEELVHSYSRYLDKCESILKKVKSRSASASRLRKIFLRLASMSEELEYLLTRLSSMIAQNELSFKDLDDIAPIIFYVYEVAVEEERNLWAMYSRECSHTEINSATLGQHYARLDRMRKLAEDILITIERQSA